MGLRIWIIQVKEKKGFWLYVPVKLLIKGKDPVLRHQLPQGKFADDILKKSAFIKPSLRAVRQIPVSFQDDAAIPLLVCPTLHFFLQRRIGG